MIEFSKPGIGYAEVWPMLLIFGVACAGVLVEAFAPRSRRYVAQVVLGLAGLGAAFVGTVMIGLDLTEHARGSRARLLDRRGRHRRRRPGRVHVGPRPAARDRRGAAVRRAPPRGRGVGVRRPGRGAARHRGRARGLDPRPRPHRGLPAADVRGRRHDAVPRRQRPAHHVRRARGAVAAALPALRAGASSPPAEPGGGAEVLPARGLLVGLPDLRHRARLRLLRDDGLRRHQRGDLQRHRQPRPAADRHGHDLGGPAVQDRCRAVPGLDARRLPGRPDRGHGFMAARPRWRRSAR